MLESCLFDPIYTIFQQTNSLECKIYRIKSLLLVKFSSVLQLCNLYNDYFSTATFKLTV